MARHRHRHLDEAFLEKFGTALPENLNAEHRMVIVASEIDASSERIIEYLSTKHQVSINAATFQYFKDVDGREILTRVFLLEPEEVSYRADTKAGSKRKPKLSFEQLEGIADQAGVGNLYRHAFAVFERRFERARSTRSNVEFVAKLDGKRSAVLNLIPKDSTVEKGVAFQVYSSRANQVFGLDPGRLEEALPPGAEPWEYYSDAPPEWSGFSGWFPVDFPGRSERPGAAPGTVPHHDRQERTIVPWRSR